jgi:hypothetical protein
MQNNHSSRSCFVKFFSDIAGMLILSTHALLEVHEILHFVSTSKETITNFNSSAKKHIVISSIAYGNRVPKCVPAFKLVHIFSDCQYITSAE